MTLPAAQRRKGPRPDDVAVLDHVYSLGKSRPRPRPGRTVLACRVCDAARGRLEVKLNFIAGKLGYEIAWW